MNGGMPGAFVHAMGTAAWAADSASRAARAVARGLLWFFMWVPYDLGMALNIHEYAAIALPESRMTNCFPP